MASLAVSCTSNGLPTAGSAVTSVERPVRAVVVSARSVLSSSNASIRPDVKQRVFHCLQPSRQNFFCGYHASLSIEKFPTTSKQICSGRAGQVRASQSSFGFDGSGQTYDDEEYVEAHVMDAVRMVPSQDTLFMTMSDGTEVEVEHVNPSAGRLLYPYSTPAIFIKMGDGSDLLLPIVVGELAIGHLMKGFRREHGARPSHYDVMTEMVQALGFEVRMVKITQRVMDTYYARIYLANPDSPSCLASVDARPSDAINLAVRAQVPIFVSKSIVRSDAVHVVHRSVVANRGSSQQKQSLHAHNGASGGRIILDRASGSADEITEEMSLMKAMMAAAQEERYADAARLRDQLNSFRSRNRRQLHNKF